MHTRCVFIEHRLCARHWGPFNQEEGVVLALQNGEEEGEARVGGHHVWEAGESRQQQVKRTQLTQPAQVEILSNGYLQSEQLATAETTAGGEEGESKPVAEAGSYAGQGCLHWAPSGAAWWRGQKMSQGEKAEPGLRPGNTRVLSHDAGGAGGTVGERGGGQ